MKKLLIVLFFLALSAAIDAPEDYEFIQDKPRAAALFTEHDYCGHLGITPPNGPSGARQRLAL